jgi:polyisoprenoid-binding protein YceI
MLETQRWEIDGTRSKLSFTLRHLVVSEIAGAFARWGGHLWLDPEHTDRSQVAIWVDLASVDTGSDERDAHLRSAEFFDVERFARAEFASTDIVVRSDGDATVVGHLRLHGTTGLIEIAVTQTRSWIDDDGRMRAGYGMHGSINRQDFGLHWNQDLDVGGVVVGDRVELTATIEVVRAPEGLRAAGLATAATDAP